MPIHDELGKRMKEFYEQIPKTKLMRRTPVAVRVDGKAFHTFAKHFDKPFDEILMQSMQETMKYLCANIQGCVFGYTQSDEITLILCDYQTFNTDAFFDYEVQKLCSIIASMATLEFNRRFEHNYLYSITDKCGDLNDVDLAHDLARKKGAMFDCRVFNIPKEEVCNLIYWRQLDAARNSVQMVGQANFSHNQLQGKSCNKIQDMLMIEKGINWNDFPTYQKHGSACFKKDEKWFIDLEMPKLVGEDRAYVEKLITFED